MTASWNSTGEVGWPTGEEAQDQEPFRSDWSSFEHSLREHGFEVAPPVVDAEASAEPATAENAEPVATELAAETEASGDEAAPADASSFWSFESEETWIGAVAVDDQPVHDLADDGRAQPGTDETMTAADPADTDEVSAPGDDDADAPVLEDVGEPLERAPMSVFGDEAAPATPGAVYSPDQPSEDEPSDRWWTEPADASATTPAVAHSSTDDGEGMTFDDSSADGAVVADTGWGGDDSIAPDNAVASSADPTRGAHAPDTLPDDRLPTPPPDLFARFGRRGAAAAVAADSAEGEYLEAGQAGADAPAAHEEPAGFVPWTYDVSSAAPASETYEEPAEAVEAAGDAEAVNASDDMSWGATTETDTAQTAGWGDWSSVAEPADGAQATEPAGTTGAADGTVTNDETAESASTTDASELVLEAPAVFEATDSVPATVDEELVAPAEDHASDGMAVDWYEAAALEAVGTSTGDELSNTEFVGYDTAPLAAADATGSVPADAEHDGQDRADATDGVDTMGLAAASAAATLGHDAGIEPDGNEPSEDGDHRASGWAVLGAAAASTAWDSQAGPSHEWQADDDWPEATATDAAAGTAGHDQRFTGSAGDGQDAPGVEGETADPDADEALAASVAQPESDGAATDVVTPETEAWPMPEAVDWDAADQDAWSTPASAKSWNDSESAAAAAAVAATTMAGGASSGAANASISASVANDAANAPVDARAAAYTTSSVPAGGGLFSRYDTSPAMTVGAASAGAAAATGATTTSPRGESDLWHLVSEPSATAPASTEKRSFDPVTVFLTVLVAIIIVALLLGLLYTVAPMLTGAAH